MNREITLGLHFYQPPREVSHKNLRHIKTDLEKFRQTGKNWTQLVNETCYKPLAQKKIFQHVSYTYYGILKEQLDNLDPQTSDIMTQNLSKNGIGHPDIHPIIPDLKKEEKRILIGSGIERLGFTPKYFWAPESALDNETLMVLKEFGYQGVICAPEQIDFETGTENREKPALLELPDQDTILALPFNRPLSSQLAFAHPEEWNADHFTDTVIKPEASKLEPGSLCLGWTDGETFGEHNKKLNADFLWWLFHSSLPEQGFKVTSVNDIDIKNPNYGVLKEKTSWSCNHGLMRWHGACSCCTGDLRWKTPYYRAHKKLDREIAAIVKKELGLGQDDFEDLMIRSFTKHFKNPGPPHTSPRLSTISAYVSAKTSRTSCGTFFDDPHYSGRINLLFAYQALEHLRDAGVTGQAARIEDEYKQSLKIIPDPLNSGKTVLDMLYGLLNQ